MLQRDQMSQRLGIMHRGAGHAPPHQAPPPSQAGLPRLTSRDSDPRQLQAHTHFSGLQSQGTDRQPQQPQGLSNYQHHQIQQAYNALMQHKQQLSAEEGSSLGLGPPHPMSEPAYPLQPVPSRPGPNNMLGLPGYRALPSMTSSDYDTIMKLKEQLSGLTSFMQAQRSSEQRSMPGVCGCVCVRHLLLRDFTLAGWWMCCMSWRLQERVSCITAFRAGEFQGWLVLRLLVVFHLLQFLSAASGTCAYVICSCVEFGLL